MALAFTGFEPGDFDLFDLPDFPSRMAEIRSRLRPKLVALGTDLADAVADVVGPPVFPHAAQHLRRRVNPPAETWVAFGRDKKGYKRWTHYRIAISGAGVRVTVFVEDDADDKPTLAAALQAHPAEVLRSVAGAPVQWYTFPDSPPSSALTPEAVSTQGERLSRVKLLKFQAGIPLARAEALSLSPAAFEGWALEQMALLKPLYAAGTGG